MSSQKYLRPPKPLYRIAAVLALPLILVLCFGVWWRRLDPVQRIYMPEFLKVSTVGRVSSWAGKFRLHKKTKAAPAEYEAILVDGMGMPFLSARPGWMSAQAQVTEQSPAEFRKWLEKWVYRRAFVLVVAWPAGSSLALCFAGFVVGFWADQERHLRFRSMPRLLAGPEMVTPQQFQKRVKGDGMGIRIEVGRWPFRRVEYLRIQKALESQHVLIVGDQGAGKTQALFGFVDYAVAKGWRIVCYDPHLEFIQRYGKAGAKPPIIAAIDARSEAWNPCGELDWTSMASAEASASSLVESWYPGDVKDRDWFFVSNSRVIMKHILLNYRPNAGQLAEILTHADPLIDAIAKGTELEEILKKNAEGQRAGLVGHLTQGVLSMLRQIKTPTKAEPGWSAREWAKTRDRNIFFTSTKNTRASSTPLQRLWMDCLIRECLSVVDPDLPETLLVIDEAPTMGHLSQMPDLMAEARKSKLKTLIGFQGRAQPEKIYGKDAESILSAPFTKILLRTGEEKAAESMSRTIGQVKVEKLREHKAADGKSSFTPEQVTEPAVLPSQLSGLKNRHGYFRYDNFIVPIKIAIAPPVPVQMVGYVPPVGEPPVILPMPNLEEIRRRDQEKIASDAAKHAAAVFPIPPKPQVTATPVPGVKTTAKKKEATPSANAPVPSQQTLPIQAPAQGTPVNYLALLLDADAKATGTRQVTRFVCASCHEVDGFLGDLMEPAGRCIHCGGEFASNGGVFIRALGKED